ncbi:MAG: helix-turn-helix domain-containing protein [Parasporobacterium sp.]|nr:helix-turn-helix domain-containing protein [Parasporobacterium sp.]
MKLSLKMIAERLEKKAGILRFKDIYSTIRLERPVFLNDAAQLLADTLYIASIEEISRITEYHNGCALIVSGVQRSEPADAYDAALKSCPAVILLEGTLNALQIYELVNEIFDYYDAWEEQLNRIQQSGDGDAALFRIIDVSQDVFENQIRLCSSLDPETDLLNPLRKGSYDRRLTTEREPFIAFHPELQRRIIVRNLFAGDSIIYHLVLIGDRRSFTETDFQFLELLAEYAEAILRREYGIYSHDTSALKGLFTQALEDGVWNRPMLESELSRIRWSSDDTFCVICAGLEPAFFRTFPEIFAFAYHGQTLILANITRSPDIPDRLEEIFRSQKLCAGASNPFASLYQLSRCWRQARTAFRLSIQTQPAGKQANLSAQTQPSGLVYFRDCALYYMMDAAAREFAPEDLLSPVYIRLREHDRMYRTEYLKTLEEYLLHNQNAVQTAAALFTHRATIIYRIRRICEIGRTDLKKPDELLHLTLSFKLARLDDPARPDCPDQ